MQSKYKEMLFRLEVDWQNYIENKGKLTFEDMQLIKELVEKETPKKLIGDRRLFMGIPLFNKIRTCPRCDREFTKEEFNYSYCPDCGQKLDKEE